MKAYHIFKYIFCTLIILNIKATQYSISMQVQKEIRSEIKSKFEITKRALKSLIQQSNYIPYSEKQKILQSKFNQYKHQLNNIQQTEQKEVYKKFFPQIETYFQQQKQWLQKNKKHPVLTENLLNYILNKVILQQEADILDLEPSDIMLAYQTIRQIIRNSQIGVDESFKELNFFRDQSIACNYFPFFEQNYGEQASQLLFLDLDLITLFKHVGLVSCQQYKEKRCAEEIRLKLLPFYLGDKHNRAEIKSYNVRIDQQFEKKSGYLTRSDKDGKIVEYANNISFQAYIYQLSMHESSQIIDDAIKHPYWINNKPYNLKMALLDCCGSQIYDSYTFNQKLEQMMKNQQPLAYLIKLKELSKKCSACHKEQFKAVYQRAYKCPNYQSNLMNYLMTIQTDKQRRLNIAHRMKKNQDPTAYYWLAIQDTKLTESQQVEYFQKVLKIYPKANFLLFNSQSYFDSYQTSGKSNCQINKVTYAYNFLSNHSLYKYGSTQKTKDLSIGTDNLFKKMMSYFQQHKYNQAFYTALLLGNIGFGQGYYSAGFLLEKNYVDSSKLCKNTKQRRKQELSNSWCAMRFYLKAILRCGDFVRSSKRLALLNAKVKDIKNTLNFYNLYKASIKRANEGQQDDIAAELMFQIMEVFESQSVLIAGIQAFQILVHDLREGKISQDMFKSKLLDKYNNYYKLLKLNLKQETVEYFQQMLPKQDCQSMETNLCTGG